jgi:alkylhydroperoxidase family enzyme
VEFLRAATGESAQPLAVLGRDDESLPPRARALAAFAVTLTSQPWAVTVPNLEADELEAAAGVIAMFNYFTRVADATGIDFDYLTPLPAFEPDRDQVAVPRPARPASFERPRLRHAQLQAAWQSWRSYLLETDEPLSRAERRVLAAVAAEEAGDCSAGPVEDDGGSLAAFARKLSREPWRIESADLDRLRAAGYSEVAVLHAISVVAHQNADSRLAAGLGAGTTGR